jgi:putative transposase
MSEWMTRHLVMLALFGAVGLKRPPMGRILHSDRDSQYGSHKYRVLENQFDLTMSMS